MGFPAFRKAPVPKWRHGPAAKNKTRHFTIDYQHIDPPTAKAVLDHAEAAFADVTRELKGFDRANPGKTLVSKTSLTRHRRIARSTFPRASSCRMARAPVPRRYTDAVRRCGTTS
jgi:hypothetical protein